MPSIIKRIKSFIKELIRYIIGGTPNVSDKQYELRLKTCNGCEHLFERDRRCGLCGCWVDKKAKWATASCPDKRWPPVSEQ